MLSTSTITKPFSKFVDSGFVKLSDEQKSSFDLIIFFNSSNYFPTTVASTYNRQSNKPNFQDGLAQSVLIYDPRCREQIWRFFTYMFLHGDPIHLGFNLALQLLVGKFIHGILLTKLFWPIVRKDCSSDQKKLLRFEAEGR